MNQASALLLVDLQTGAFDGQAFPPVHSSDLLLRNVGMLLETARASAVPVVHIQHCARAGEPFAEEAPGWPIFAPVAPREGELVVRKRASDAFEGTELHQRLQEIGARTLIIAGIQTEHCVAATCRGALRAGYVVQLAADAHSTWPTDDRSADVIMAAETDALKGEGVELRPTEALIDSLDSVPLKDDRA
jgi:nicotinamidase-related amidase